MVYSTSSYHSRRQHEEATSRERDTTMAMIVGKVPAGVPKSTVGIFPGLLVLSSLYNETRVAHLAENCMLY